MKKTISIIGGGPASLAVAVFLDTLKFDITIFEKNKTLGRKFLVAGKGGFNLTHSEPIEDFVNKYTPNDVLKNALLHFDNVQLQEWLQRIGIPTFVGSSKRVYPQDGIKPIEVLNAITNELEQHNVNIEFEHKWTGWTNENHLLFQNEKTIQSDYTIFALGGGSWQVTGSDGSYLNIFSKKSIETKPFQPSNCAYQINWEDNFIKKNAGTPLKNIAIRCGDKTQKGEAVITNFGLEGNAIYGLSPNIREQLNAHNTSTIFIDLKPTLTQEAINNKFEKSKLKKTSDILRKEIKLNTVQLDLLKSHTSKELFLNIPLLAKSIKNLEITISETAKLDEAISTVGGISFNAIDNNFELKKMPNQFCIGEMLDYDAPTGGYLLQACFSMGAYLANHLNIID